MKIYLAGPDVFRNDAKIYFNTLRSLCEKFGHEALIPLDNQVEEHSDKAIVSAAIFQGNIAMMDQADVIFANIEPFRGACMDDGTAFEIGYCFSRNKKIYAYSSFSDLTLLEITFKMFDLKVQPQFGLVEDFDSCVNLMISNAVKKTGGKILPNFEDCLKDLM
jgi:nucleoside 2-deoxyribosyltransferase